MTARQEGGVAGPQAGQPAYEMKRAVAWVKDDPFGVEFAEALLGARWMNAEGVAIGTQPVPYRLDYSLETAPGFVTTRLRVRSRGEGWSRTLDLRRAPDGEWSVTADQQGSIALPSPGGDPAALADALDCDLGLSPLTNTLPVMRHGLLSRASVELTAAWVSVPDLSVRADGQRYTFVRPDEERSVVRFEAVDGTFAADITLDPHGMVIDYPGIARCLSEVHPGLGGRP